MRLVKWNYTDLFYFDPTPHKLRYWNTLPFHPLCNGVGIVFANFHLQFRLRDCEHFLGKKRHFHIIICTILLLYWLFFLLFL